MASALLVHPLVDRGEVPALDPFGTDGLRHHREYGLHLIGFRAPMFETNCLLRTCNLLVFVMSVSTPGDDLHGGFGETFQPNFSRLTLMRGTAMTKAHTQFYTLCSAPKRISTLCSGISTSLFSQRDSHLCRILKPIKCMQRKTTLRNLPHSSANRFIPLALNDGNRKNIPSSDQAPHSCPAALPQQGHSCPDHGKPE